MFKNVFSKILIALFFFNQYIFQNLSFRNKNDQKRFQTLSIDQKRF